MPLRNFIAFACVLLLSSLPVSQSAVAVEDDVPAHVGSNVQANLSRAENLQGSMSASELLIKNLYQSIVQLQAQVDAGADNQAQLQLQIQQNTKLLETLQQANFGVLNALSAATASMDM